MEIFLLFVHLFMCGETLMYTYLPAHTYLNLTFSKDISLVISKYFSRSLPLQE